MSATIEDVARLAEVSVATVSRALRGLPNVAPSTRERVVAAAAELRYVADPHAARLAARRTATIGLLIPLLGSWYHSKVFSGAEGVLAGHGYDVLPAVLGSPETQSRYLRELPFRKRVDGLLVIDVPFDDEQLEVLASGGVPVVAVGLETDRVVSLVVNNRRAARTAVEHLIALGHRRIGLIGELPGSPLAFQIPVERRAGYREALERAGIPVREELVVAGNFSLEGGAEAMSHLLHLDEPPTAVFAMSDEMAIGAMQVARDAGLQIPDQLSVVGFDDHDVAAYVGLTTVRQDVEEHGERGASVLLEQIGEGEAPAGTMRLPTRLIVRQSSAAAPESA